jgi:cell wall-associated NlpC family hydrolase
VTTPSYRDNVASEARAEARRAIRAAKPGNGGSPVIPIIMIGLGLYLAWFAIRYWRDKTTIWPSDPVKDVLQGKGLPKPDRAVPVAARAGDAEAAAGPAAAEASGGHFASEAGQFGGADGEAIAKDAASYAGKVRYVWGGANPATGWDCSGMVNYVLCHDLGLNIPGYKGGTFNGKQHGTNVAGWLAWSGAAKIGTWTPPAGGAPAAGSQSHASPPSPGGLWWIDQGNSTVVEASRAHGDAESWVGPYPTKAAAEAALRQAQT